MKFLLVSTFIFFFSTAGVAQKYVSQEDFLTFFSDTVVEDIRAENKAGVSLIDFGSKAIIFIVKVREFNFEKALMQEHFKEKYIEADKYPKADFKGTFEGFDAKVTGEQHVTAKGVSTIHGQSRDVLAKGIMRRDGNLIHLKSEIKIQLKDYNISIPKILWQNIAEDIFITVDFLPIL